MTNANSPERGKRRERSSAGDNSIQLPSSEAPETGKRKRSASRRKELMFPVLEGLLGAGVFGVLPDVFDDLGYHKLTIWSWWASLLLGVMALAHLTAKLEPKWARRSWLTFGVFSLLATVAFVVWTLRLPLKEAPDVALSFVYSKLPALVIENKSEVVAREIKWAVILWNLDLPDRNDPLPIPVNTFDWVRPHSRGGAQSLFGRPEVAALVKRGDRIVGSVSVSCPYCAEGRTYLLSIRFGESGWYAEIEGEGGNLVVPKDFSRNTREAFFKQFESLTPVESRVTIVDP